MYRTITFLLILIPALAFAKSHESIFDHAAYGNAKLSPDGKYIAVSMRSDGKMAIAFLARNSMELAGSLRFANSYEVGDFKWINNERVVINMVKSVPWREEPQFYGELYAVNFDGSKGELIYGYQAGEQQTGSHLKKKESIRGWGSLADPLLNDKKHILVSSTPMSKNGERHASLLKINAYTGVIRKKIVTAPVAFSRFFLDAKGKPVAVTGINENNDSALYLRSNNDWIKVKDNIASEEVLPISVTNDGNYLYTLDNLEASQKGLYKLNTKDLTYKHIFTDKKVDIASLALSLDNNIPYALKLYDGYPSYIVLNSKIEEGQVFKNIVKSFPYSSVNITSKSKDGRYYIVLSSSDTNPGALYLFDREKNQLSFLFKYKPNFTDKDFAQIEPVSVKTTDNYELPGYFTPAKGVKSGTKTPAIVLVHGGPHGVRDYWGFSSQVQYLSANGFSVLQVNYRGSGGYGSEHETAGYRNWGTLIQEDIRAGYQWLVENNKADANNVCIMGGSFGAYSAIQSLAKYPETYQCAVANAGVYDLELMFEEGDIPGRRSGLSYLKEVLGEDESELKANSPNYYVEKIQAPILLAHGEEDERAPIEHAERLKEALDKADKDYDWYVLEDEEHGFYNPENQKAYMKKVVNFLNEHLKS